MRAEAQTHIDQINAATALLRRFLDWDRAQRRLEELNAKVEEPALWDDPKAAQDVMRDRFHILGHDIRAVLDARVGLGDMREGQRRSRRRAVLDAPVQLRQPGALRLARRDHERDDVLRQPLVERHGDSGAGADSPLGPSERM